MSNSIRVNTGKVTLEVNDSGDTISFNVDVVFMERFQKLYDHVVTAEKDYEAREAVLDKDNTTDENGIPSNLAAKIALLKEFCIDCRAQIDTLFGDGTSDKVFGDSLLAEMFAEFLEAVTPFVAKVRAQAADKHLKRGKSGVMR